MQVRPSRGHGDILAAALSKTALKKAHEDIESKLATGMTWEEAGKAIEASMEGIEYASQHDVIALLQKMASKNLKVGSDEAMEKEAQHWLGRGLNWLADTAKGVGQGIGDAAKGVGDWAKGKMEAANQWQQLQPKLQAIRQALDFIEKNPNSLRGMMPQLISHVRSLGQQMQPAAPAQAPVPTAPQSPVSPFSGQSARGLKPVSNPQTLAL